MAVISETWIVSLSSGAGITIMGFCWRWAMTAFKHRKKRESDMASIIKSLMGSPEVTDNSGERIAPATPGLLATVHRQGEQLTHIENELPKNGKPLAAHIWEMNSKIELLSDRIERAVTDRTSSSNTDGDSK